MFAGKRAGTQLRYVMVKIGGKAVQAHRIIWEMHNGPVPVGREIDHINGNRADNRIENLRLATGSKNKMNTTLRKDNTSGLKGVRRDRRSGRWSATIKADKKTIHLGSFGSPEEAHTAYVAAAEVHHGQFARNAKFGTP